MKLSKKALEDFLKQYKPKIECKDGFMPLKAYHDWLNEEVECPRCKGLKCISFEGEASRTGAVCFPTIFNPISCNGKGTISRAEKYLE